MGTILWKLRWMDSGNADDETSELFPEEWFSSKAEARTRAAELIREGKAEARQNVAEQSRHREELEIDEYEPDAWQEHCPISSVQIRRVELAPLTPRAMCLALLNRRGYIRREEKIMRWDPGTGWVKPGAQDED